MRVKTDAGWGMREILTVRCGMKRLRRQRDTENHALRKLHGERDKYSEFGGMAGLSQKQWRDAGFAGKLDSEQTVILVMFTALHAL